MFLERILNLLVSCCLIALSASARNNTVRRAAGFFAVSVVAVSTVLISSLPAFAADTATGSEKLPSPAGEAPSPAFHIIAYGDADIELARELAPMISDQLFNIPVVVLDKRIEEPEDAYVEIRDKFYGGKLLDQLFEMKPEGSLGFVGLTDRDIYIGRRPHVRGVSDPDRGVAVVSTFRLLSASAYRFKIRTLKEMLHELGHLLGQEHDIDPSHCVMGLSITLMQLDAKSREFCPYHKRLIRLFLEKEKGLDLSQFSTSPDESPGDETKDETDKTAPDVNGQ